MKAIKYILFGLLGLIVVLGVALFIWYKGTEAEPELHIIPSDYEGPVVIIFGDTNGQAKTYEDGFRVYKIPDHGILVTQFERQTGYIRPGKLKYVYESSEGERTEIPYVDVNPEQDLSSSEVCVFQKQLSAQWERYLVGRRGSGERLYKEMEELTNKAMVGRK